MKPRSRKCKIGADGCDGTYTPFNSMQKCCSNPFCALEVGRAAIAKKERVKHRQDKERIKTRSEWVQEAEAAVRFYVRMRDKRDNRPCASCGRHEHDLGGDPRGGLWDAGHYLGKGAHPEHRFDVRQIWRQCKNCNRDKSGSPIPYRKTLIERMGIEYVEWLEGPHKPAKWTIEELKEIKAKYNKLANAIKKELQ